MTKLNADTTKPASAPPTVSPKDYPHLKESVLATLSLPDKERIQKCKQLDWVAYPRAKEILDKLEDLADSPRTHRPPSMLLVGDSNNGKTAIARRFLDKHPETLQPTANKKHIPVVYIECPEKPEEKRLYELLLGAVGDVIPATASIPAIQRSLCTIYPEIGVQLIIIDEIHNVLIGGAGQQRAFLTILKGISNRTQIPIVVIGIQTALSMFGTDDQISNRFEAVALPRWDMSDDYMRLLASFERLLPLHKPSQLTQAGLPEEILALSEGLIGEMLKLLTAAGAEAIRTKTERITLELIRSLKWRPPSVRKQVPT